MMAHRSGASGSRGRRMSETETLMDTPDSNDSSSQQEGPPSAASTSDSTSQDATDAANSKTQTITFLCLWKGCTTTFGEDPMGFFNHLMDHAFENMAGPCFWKDCAHCSARVSRHQSRFMEHHIKQHMPKKAFRCFMDGCNKRFDTPDCLNNHLNKHPQPKKNEKPDFKLDDPTAGQIREVPIEYLGFLEGNETIQQSLKLQEIFRQLGIFKIPFQDEYFISIHGLPQGDIKSKPYGYEQKYKLHFPYAPTWIKDAYVRCFIEDAGPWNEKSVLMWKLPLSNPLFKPQLRSFISQMEREILRIS